MAKTTVPVSLTGEQNHDLLNLIGSGQRIEAIKRYREITGARLERAVLAITAMSSDLDQPGNRTSVEPTPEVRKQAEGEALASIRKGDPGGAVRQYQRYTTLSLRESKLAVNALVLVHLSEGRVNAKVAHALVPLLSSGQRQEAVDQLMFLSGYEKAEAKALAYAAEKAINRGGSGVSGPPWIAFGLGLVIFMLLLAVAFVALS